MQSLRLSAWSSALPTSHHRGHYPTGSSPLALPRHGLRKEEPPFTNGRFDALASCLLERLLVREGAVVGKLLALKADDLPEDLVVHHSELGDVFRTESPCNTSVQGNSHLGLQHAGFQTKWRRLPIVQLRSEPLKASPHETDPSVDFEPEVSVFVDDSAEVWELGRIPLASCCDHE